MKINFRKFLSLLRCSLTMFIKMSDRKILQLYFLELNLVNVLSRMSQEEKFT